MGYGGACPDYSVGDARFANSFISYGDDACMVNRLRVSCFCLAVTITDFRFSGIPEFGNRNSEDGLRYRLAELAASPNRYRDTEEISFGWRKLA
jgi:hypothetical protein